MAGIYSDWQREKYYNDEQFKLKRKVANAIRKGLKGQKMLTGTLAMLDYDMDELRDKLQKEYGKPVDWEQLGKTLDLDHRIPDSWFTYESPDDIEFSFAWSMDNLQLMDRIENREKKNTIAHPCEKQLEIGRIQVILRKNGYYGKK